MAAVTNTPARRATATVRATRRLLSVLLIPLAGACGRTAAVEGASLPSASDSPRLLDDPALSSGTLDNGLSFYVRQNEQPDERALLVLVVRAGSLLERDDERGFSHFVEHMAFNGTSRFEEERLMSFFERAGMRFGADANALTGHDRTLYLLRVPTDTAELLDTGLEVLVDWAGAIRFDPEKVDAERKILLAERLHRSGARQRLGDRLGDLTLAGTRYADRNPIGDADVIETASPERLESFYRDWYAPENMAVIAVGDFDPQAVRAAIERAFGGLRASGTRRLPPDLERPRHAAPRAFTLEDREATSRQALVSYQRDERPFASEADHRTLWLDSLWSHLWGERLARLARRPDSPFVHAGTNVRHVLPGLDACENYVVPKQGEGRRAVELLSRELGRLERHGFTRSELSRGIEAMRGRADAMLEGHADRTHAARALSLADAFVRGQAMPSERESALLGKRHAEHVTLEEVNRAARDWLSVRDPVVAYVSPGEQPEIEPVALLAAFARPPAAPLGPYVDEPPARSLELGALVPGRVVSEEAIAEIGVLVWTLDNGARVVLKPTDFAEGEILEQSISDGGHSLASAANYPAALLANEIVLASGAGEHGVDELRKLLAGKRVEVIPWVAEHEEGVRASASPRDAETMLQLMHLFLRTPRRDEAAFESYRASQREQLLGRQKNPVAAFFDQVSREAYADHPRRRALTLGELEAIELDASLAFYRDRFGDVGDFTFVFVGNLDPATFKPWVERYLGSLHGTPRNDRWKDVGAEAPEGVLRIVRHGGLEPKSYVTLDYHGPAQWSQEAADDVAWLRDYLDLQLRETIREDEGGSYGVYVSARLSRRPEHEYSVGIVFDCPAERTDELRRITFQVIEDMKRTPPPDHVVEQLRALRTRELETLFSRNDFWLEELVEHYKFGTDPRATLELKRAPERLSAARLQRAARSYLDASRYVDATLLPAAAEP